MNNHNNDILEYMALNKTTPVNFTKTGVVLFLNEPKWIFPFKKTKLLANVKVVIPDKTFGLITSLGYNGIDVFTDVINESDDTYVYIKVKRTGLFPKKLKNDMPIALLTIVPCVEFQLVENNDMD